MLPLTACSGVPHYLTLNWRNQFVTRIGWEFAATESAKIQAGYSYANNPVPTTMLTPLTAAIFQNSVSAGLSYRRSRVRYDLTYSISPSASESVDQSLLLSGEYSHSRVRMDLQSVTLGTSFRF
jgi:long-subunit fatty acid transport protein